MNIIDQAADRLRGNWRQGVSTADPNSSVCIIGALSRVADWKPLPDGSYAADVSQEIISEVLKAETGQPWIVSFNDDPATTEEDVLLLLKRASVLYDERHPS